MLHARLCCVRDSGCSMTDGPHLKRNVTNGRNRQISGHSVTMHWCFILNELIRCLTDPAWSMDQAC